jgi:hypothetical protein
MYKAYEYYLNTLHLNEKYGRLGHLRQESHPTLLDFSTNDYLNLSQNKEVMVAGESVAQRYGMGSTGSRLLSGNCKIFEEFEDVIAKDKKNESSLIFNSGFQANISTLACISDDKIVHNSHANQMRALMPLATNQNYDRLKEIAHIIAAAIVGIQSSKNLGKSRLLEKNSLDFSSKGSASRASLLEKTNYGQEHERICY